MTIRRWLAAAAAAVGLVAMSAGPAAAQYPGANGRLIYDQENGRFGCGPDGPDDEYYYFDFETGQRSGAVSADGSTEAYTVQRRDGQFGVLLWPSAGPAATGCAGVRFFPGASDPWSDLSFSPDGRELAVQKHGDVVVISTATGAELRNLTPGLATTTEGNPTWDPKNRWVAYEATDGIRTRPVAGGAGKLLVKGGRAPDVSPDGRYIAYLRGDRIEYASATTGALVKRTPIRAVEFTYSPDGKLFAFQPPLPDNGDLPGCVIATTNGLITSRIAANPWCYVIAWQPVR